MEAWRGAQSFEFGYEQGRHVGLTESAFSWKFAKKVANITHLGDAPCSDRDYATYVADTAGQWSPTYQKDREPANLIDGRDSEGAHHGSCVIRSV
jgi:hypothetical protein